MNRLNPRELLQLFKGEQPFELRYKDIVRSLQIREEERAELDRLLNDLVRSDFLRLRKGKWYRQGPGGDLKAVPARVPALKRRRDAIFEGIFTDKELPVRFDQAVLEEAAAIPETVLALPDEAVDFRRLPLVTIDPADAKDFDDAVCASERPDGAGIRLFVAIADVSHYVRPSGAIDREALKRGNSVYVPGSVVPMLPFELSNGICSLKPDEERLAVVVQLDYDPKGRLEAAAFNQALIRSRRRLTYKEAQAILDGEDAGGKEIQESFRRMATLFHLLFKSRQRRGSLDLDIPEPQMILGEDGRVEDIRRYPRHDSNRLIEEFMVAANEAVAAFLSERGAPCVYRVHERPDADKIGAFGAIARALGFAFPDEVKVNGKELNRFLAKIKDAEERDYLHILLLRSLKQALYRPQNLGHFGLALKYYSHFTSPIRRYPDLIVHRLLKQVLAGRLDGRKRDILSRRLPDVCEHCSMTERRAMEIERKTAQVCQAELMEARLGECFQGMISGVLAFGFFVQLHEPFVEGLVHVSQLRGDYYRFVEEEHTLVGERTKRRYRLGDKVKVQLIRVDIPRGRIDFTPAPEEKDQGSPSAAHKHPQPVRREEPARRRTSPRRHRPGRGARGKKG